MKRGVESFLGSFRTVIKGPLVRSTQNFSISMIQWKPVYIVASHKKTSPRQVCGAMAGQCARDNVRGTMCAGPFLGIALVVDVCEAVHDFKFSAISAGWFLCNVFECCCFLYFREHFEGCLSMSWGG